MTVIVACGAKKLSREAPARDLYTGGYFKACLAYALKIAPAENVRILSAKHGLIGLNDVIAPYNRKMGDPSSITESALTEQAEAQELLAEKVVVLGGRLYAGLCQKVWREVEAPLEGKGGLGQQIAWMKKQLEVG